MSRRLLLEIAVSTPHGAAVAAANGADRLELSSALEIGGVTPSLGVFREVRGCVALPVYVLLRPRPGGFHYTPRECAAMRADAEVFLAEGAAGLVFGIVDEHGEIDREQCRVLVELARGRVVFHRAFDFLPDSLRALDALIDLGFERVLTGGGAHTAKADPTRLAELVKHAAGRIDILPAGGIREHNVAEVINNSGCTQVHSAALISSDCPLGRANALLAPAMSGTTETSALAVRGLRQRLDRLAESLS